jgi:UDP-N-acetyl-D-galactosamine dehydrogenase
MILAGRRLNDSMARVVAERVAQLMGKKSLLVNRARVLVMGLTFKENCPDVRNSKVVDLIRALERYGATVDAWDPWVDPKHVKHEYGITPITTPRAHTYDAVVVAVSHNAFKKLGIKGVRRFAKSKRVIFDIKHLFKARDVDGRL